MGYPLSAVVGKEQAKKALLLALINPLVGGVLLTGEKGTGKTLLVRGISELESRRSMIDIPLHVTGEQLQGDEAGGLLKRAAGQMVYIDEINLLPMETASIICSESQDFLLFGTMDPEEASLPGCLKERFGMVVYLENERSPRERAEIIRRRLAYEDHPEEFEASFRRQTKQLKMRIDTAKERLRRVKVTENAMTAAAEMAQEAACEGNRAELYLIQTARAIAAWENATAVSASHLLEAAQYVFPCRGREPLSQRWIDRRADTEENTAEDTSGRDGADDSKAGEERVAEGKNSEKAAECGSGGTENLTAAEAVQNGCSGTEKKQKGDTASEGAETEENESAEKGGITLNGWLDTREKLRIRTVRNGGKRNIIGKADRGHYLKTAPGSPDSAAEIAFGATLLRAAAHGGGRLPLRIEPWDIRLKSCERKSGYYILFAIDSSASMGARERMEAVRKTVLSMLRESYEKRDRIGLVAFQGRKASLLLEFTNSMELAARRLTEFPVRGRTPLAEGLRLSYQVLKGAMAKERGIVPVFVLITDGRATWGKSGDPFAEAQRAAEKFAAEAVRCIVIDTEQGRTRLGLSRKLAEAMQGELYSVDRLGGDSLRMLVRSLL